MRNELCRDENLDVLEKVGDLALLPETGWVTLEQAADFYEVPTSTIKMVVSRHREEFLHDGYKVLNKKDLEKSHLVTFKVPNRGLAIFTRRALLRLGMVLRESKVAKQVRTYLLNVERTHSGLSLVALRTMAEQLSHQATESAQNAKQLTAHAAELTRHAVQLDRNAAQLIGNSELIKAMVNSINHNQNCIQGLEKKFASHDKRIERLENGVPTQPASFIAIEANETISREQINTLRNRVRKKEGHPVTIWHKFNRHFEISRYSHLSKDKYEEALEWIESYGR